MSNLNDFIQERIKKINEMQRLGFDPYPEKVHRGCTILEALKYFNKWRKSQKTIILTGRVWAIRGHGKLIFADIRDQSAKIQIVLKIDYLKKEKLEFFEKFVDIGDFLEVKGILHLTRTKEKSLLVKNFNIISKSLRPLPKSWYGLRDIEERYRHRYLDLLENEEVKERAFIRAKIINFIRNFLVERGYLEVETPILQPVYGGANARPFVTHLEALNLKLYLRIAPELYLKRLLIGGFENIFEIGKNFRNEGLDREHNPEFSMIELYSAYKTREDLMRLVKQLFLSLSLYLKKEFKNSPLLIDLPRQWYNKDYEEFLREKTGLTLKDDLKKWQQAAQKLQIEINPEDDKAKISDSIFKKLRSQIITPTFILNHPVEISPLAKKIANEPTKTARFQLIIKGWELANGFSELNDPLEQRKRLEEQSLKRNKGDLEAHPFDESFIEALEYGMPPAAGLGIGLDRLVALFTQAPSLKEVILFPFMRSK